MKPFVFSLMPVLRLKQAQEKQQAAALSALQQRIHSVLEDTQQLETALSVLISDQERQSLQGMPPWKMEGYARYAQCLFEQKNQKEREAAELADQEEAIKRVLLEMRQEMKLLQNLREKRYASYLKDLETAQQKEMDERIAFLESAALQEA